jgi:predicted PurR-regulated permease PerM
MMEETKHPFYIRLAAILISVMLILVLLKEGSSIIIPLFFSLLIALMLLPFTKWLERRRFPRGLAAGTAILVFVAFVGGLFFFLGAQMAQFSKDLPLLGDRLQTWVADTQVWVANKYGLDTSKQLEYLNRGAESFATWASVVAQALVLAVSGFAIWTLFVFIFTFFILTHRSLLKSFVTELFQRKDQAQVKEIIIESRQLANSYILGLLIEMVVVAVMNCISLFAFGIKYALLLGVLTAVFNIIPYIGFYTATAFAAVITLSDASPAKAITVVVVLLTIHLIDANVIMPRIVGKKVNMNPLVTIVAVIVGSHLWGIAGMFLFIPLIAILKIIFERVEGLKPWAILIGTEDELQGTKK